MKCRHTKQASRVSGKYLAQRYDERVLQGRLVEDLPVHIGLEILDEIPARQQLDGYDYWWTSLVVHCSYHQAKCAIAQHPRLQHAAK